MGKLKIMGVEEINDRLDGKKGYAAVLHLRGQLPPHDDAINGGRTKVWLVATIEKWMKDTGR